MANRLQRATIDAMFQAYAEKQTVEYVSAKCGVHHATVRRHRTLGKWDERLARIQQQREAETDYNLAKATAQSVKMVRRYKDKLCEALKQKDVSPDDIDAQELDRVISLEQRLLGGGIPQQQTIYIAQIAALLNQQVDAASLPACTSTILDIGANGESS